MYPRASLPRVATGTAPRRYVLGSSQENTQIQDVAHVAMARATGLDAGSSAASIKQVVLPQISEHLLSE